MTELLLTFVISFIISAIGWSLYGRLPKLAVGVLKVAAVGAITLMIWSMIWAYKPEAWIIFADEVWTSIEANAGRFLAAAMGFLLSRPFGRRRQKLSIDNER